MKISTLFAVGINPNGNYTDKIGLKDADDEDLIYENVYINNFSISITNE